MIGPGLLRCKYLCAEYGRVVVAILVIVSVVAVGASVWIYTHPETEQVTEEIHRQTIETQADTETVVTGDTPLWEEGTVLKNRPFYPMDAAPNLTITVRTVVPDGQPVRVSHRISVMYQVRRGDATIWQNEEPIHQDNLRVSNGEATSQTTLSIREIHSRIGTLSSALSGVGNVEVRLKLNASYQTKRYAGRLSSEAPLSVSGSGYWLSGDLRDDRTHSTTVTRERTDRNEMMAAALALLGLLAAAGAGVTGRFYYDGPDGREIKRQIDRERCFDWISEGRISRSIGHHDIEMNTLEDLVDVAIDSKRRVVYDSDRDLYAVVDLDSLYYFDPSPGSADRVDPPSVGDQAVQSPRRPEVRRPAQDVETGYPPSGPDRDGTEPEAATGSVKGNGGNGAVPTQVDVTFVRKRWRRLLDEEADGEVVTVSEDAEEFTESPVADGGVDPDADTAFGEERWAGLLEPEE